MQSAWARVLRPMVRLALAHGLKHAAKAGVAGMLTAGDAPMFLASGLGTRKDSAELGEG